MRGNSFLLRMLGRDADEDETRTYSAQEEIETKWSWRREPEEGQQPRGFTVERAAEIIDELPPDVPRESALRIVRRTLAAAGIEVGDFDKSARAQEAKLNSKIELARNRQREVGQKTDEVIRSLEGRIRKAQETYEAIYVEEEREISRVSKKLENIKRTRAFFGLPEMEGEQNTGSSGEVRQHFD
jgi:myosin heavy subunit